MNFLGLATQQVAEELVSDTRKARNYNETTGSLESSQRISFSYTSIQIQDVV